MCFILHSEDHYNFQCPVKKYSGSPRFQEQTRKLLLFLVCNKNSPEGKIKTKAKVRSPIGSVNGSLNWFMSLF